MHNEPIAASQEDLLSLEYSHDVNLDDVSKPIQSDDPFPAFQTVSHDDDEVLLGQTNNLNDSTKGSSLSLNSGSDPHGMNNQSSNTLGNDDPLSPSNARCWNVEYYRPYFDIDTSMELQRLKKSLFPWLSGQFFDEDLNEQPDLYGPFWITSTLAFLMAAMGNFSSYLNTSNHSNTNSTGTEDTDLENIIESQSSKEWSGDITRISEAATFLYIGSVLVPALLWLVLRSYDASKGLVELVSIYGYSLSPFIVACILCLAPWNFFDWAVVLTCMCSSVLFLIKNVYRTLPEDKRQKPGWFILAIIVLCQFILALALKLYFFKY